MAFAATTVWEVRADGNDANGGGFDPVSGVPGTDYSQQASAQHPYIDLKIDASTNTDVTSVERPFTAADVGNFINVTSGTGFTVQRVQIMSVTAGVARGDKSFGTLGSTNGVGNFGGAMATPEALDSLLVAGNTMYIRGGTYTKTSTRTLTFDGSLAAYIRVIGYKAGGTRANIACREADMPVFTSATNSVGIFTITGLNKAYFRNIKCTHTAATRGSGWLGSTTASPDVIWDNCVTDGCISGWADTSGLFTRNVWGACTARNMVGSASGAGFNIASTTTVGSYFFNCKVETSAGHGFATSGTTNVGSRVTLVNCIAANCTGSGFKCASTTGAGYMALLANCTFYANNIGIEATTTSGTVDIHVLNCIFDSNTTAGLQCTTASVSDGWMQWNNAFRNNGANRVNVPAGLGDITLTADPFLAKASNDFRLNHSPGGGNLLRKAGYPAQIGALDDVTLTYQSVGAFNGWIGRQILPTL